MHILFHNDKNANLQDSQCENLIEVSTRGLLFAYEHFANLVDANCSQLPSTIEQRFSGGTNILLQVLK